MESAPIEVTVGDTPAVAFSGRTNWPESLHECSLASEALPTRGEVTVKVKHCQLEAAVTLKGTTP